LSRQIEKEATAKQAFTFLAATPTKSTVALCATQTQSVWILEVVSCKRRMPDLRFGMCPKVAVVLWKRYRLKVKISNH